MERLPWEQYDECDEYMDADMTRTLQQIKTVNNVILKDESETLKQQITALRSELSVLQEQMDCIRADMAKATVLLKAEQQQINSSLNLAIAEHGRVVRSEIEKMFERSDRMQKLVLIKVDEAREAQKRSESRLTKTEQKSDRSSDEIQDLKTRLVTLSVLKNRFPADLGMLTGNEELFCRGARAACVAE